MSVTVEGIDPEILAAVPAWAVAVEPDEDSAECVSVHATARVGECEIITYVNKFADGTLTVDKPLVYLDLGYIHGDDEADLAREVRALVAELVGVAERLEQTRKVDA